MAEDRCHRCGTVFNLIHVGPDVRCPRCYFAETGNNPLGWTKAQLEGAPR